MTELTDLVQQIVSLFVRQDKNMTKSSRKMAIDHVKKSITIGNASEVKVVLIYIFSTPQNYYF